MAEPIRVALVGCGDISSTHLRSYQNLGMKVVGLCDVILPRAQRRKEEFGLTDTPIFEDFGEMLKKTESDLVTVATPVACHAPLTIAALRAGRHVACEKPSTLCIAENKQVIEEAKKAGKKVIFFSSRMRWAEVSMARQFIQDGELGEIYRVNVQFFRRRGRPGVDMMHNARWFVDREKSGGGVVMDMGQYFMDMVFSLTGWPEIQSATGWTFKGFPHELPEGIPFDVEEHCTIFARSAKCSYTFDLAWISNHPDTRSIYILGTKGGITINKDGSYRIDQVVYVTRDGHKKIVLGAGGQTIKSIGAESRKELMEIFEVPVHLFLFVKVREKWGDDPERYREMGLEFPKE